jgi:hypothetical protein
MYRGIVTLDATGQATIELPEYYDAVNINPSYQLTAIGTPTQPYVATEITNNQFTVAGAPNTKVSWTVHAQRNDPTIRYFDANGKNYSSEVFEKPAKMKGKYYNPEAYNKPANMGIHYSANFQEKIEKAKTIKQKSMERPTKKTVLPHTAQPDTKKETTEAKETTQNLADGEDEVTGSK